jgi:hypothetical protein
MLFAPNREPDHATLRRRLHQPSHRSTGEVGFLRAYFHCPLSAKRTTVPVLLYEALPKRQTAANLAASG